MGNSPELDQVHFTHSLLDGERISVRGKTASSGAHGTFQWTTAVQALSVLLLRGALNASNFGLKRFPVINEIKGEKGSLAASLDYAIDKQPAWLAEMFGTDAQGASLFRRLITRNNSGGRRPGPVSITLNLIALPPERISITLDGTSVHKPEEQFYILRNIEKACGSVDSSEESAGISIDSATTLPPTSVSTYSASQKFYKTPFLLQEGEDGYVQVRVYEGDNCTALVALYSKPEKLFNEGEVLVRIHSSCINSDILGTYDCDCRDQLLESRRLLSKQGGLLIHLSQEGRGSGLFSKFMGLSIMHNRLVSTYEAYRSLSLSEDSRSYSLVGQILDDLGIKSVRLLTNNPQKVASLREMGIDVSQESLFGSLTPYNFNYLYSKFTEGDHLLENLFAKGKDRLFFQNNPSNKLFRTTWIFDADDTLWEDNLFYEDFIRQFTDRLVRAIPELSREEIRSTIDSMEVETLWKMGYGAPGFLTSLKRAFEHFDASYPNRMKEPTDLFDSIIPTLTSIPTSITDSVKEVLSQLRERGDGLILATHGPIDIQLGKISRSGLAERFDAISVTETKDDSIFRWIMDSFSTPAKEFCVVGNNLQTEIVPAINLGLKAYYYRNPNSWVVLNRSQVASNKYHVISSLKELL